VKTDKKRRSQLRYYRKVLHLKQDELATLADVRPEMVARYERGKRVSQDTDARIVGAIFRMAAKKSPEGVNQAAQPLLAEAEKWEKVLHLEPGSDLALELEKLNGKTLAELKAQVRTMADFLRSGANIALSLTK
jgi:transcriptional regulator with XRE-family HTH domain